VEATRARGLSGFATARFNPGRRLIHAGALFPASTERPAVTRRVAIVGAGVAGAAAAYRLQRAVDVAVTVFESRSQPGGRAATRSREDTVYDVGANYLSLPDEDPGRIEQLVEGPLADDLVTVDGRVWTVDADGTIEPGRDEGEPKWTGARGIDALADRLLATTDAIVACESGVRGIAAADAGWAIQLDGTDQTGHSAAAEAFDDVLLTPPGPTTAGLLDGVAGAARLRDAAAAIDYRSITTVAARYDRPLDLPYYALVDVSKSRPLGWLARESCKPGHLPDGEVLILQGSPEWSREHSEEPDRTVADDATALAAALLDRPWLTDPDWIDVVRWRHALADDGLPAAVADRAPEGLHVAGDWVAGEPRLHAAIRSGLDAGAAIVERQ